jgi:hypothetical protein
MPQVITEIQNQMTTADINTRKICGLIETDQAGKDMGSKDMGSHLKY